MGSLTSIKYLGAFLWRVDDHAVYSYGDDDHPVYFTLPAVSWEDMGKPATITITVIPGDTLNG